MPRFLPTLALGFAVSGTVTWFALRPAASSASSSSSTHPAAPVALSAWSWRDSAAPALLAPDTASAAIAAWFALRAPDGSIPAFAARADALRTLLVRLHDSACPSLLDAFLRVTAPDDIRLRQIAFSTWLERDPAAAARWAVAARPAMADFASDASRAWARLDAPAAAAWACALPDKTVARDLARDVLPILADTDPSLALTLATAQGEAFLAEILPGLISKLAKTDPAAVLRTYGPRLWKEGDGFWHMQEALGAWAKLDPAGAMAWLVAQPRKGDYQLSNWIGNLVRNDGDHAALAQALATVPGLTNRHEALSELLFSWSSKDPVATLAWLDALPDRDLRRRLLERASGTTYTEHPERTLPFALALPEGPNRSHRIGQLLGDWAKVNPSAALAWIAGQTEPDIVAAASSAHAAILGTIARDEPATAVSEWNALADPKAREAACWPIAESWGRTDPAAALQWFAANTPSDRFGDPSGLLFSWSQKDSLSALRWTESIADAAKRERYLAALAGTRQDKAPRAATADLYSKINDPALRAKTLSTHVAEWLTKDPAAAKTWLEQSSALTPEQTAALLAVKSQ